MENRFGYRFYEVELFVVVYFGLRFFLVVSLVLSLDLAQSQELLLKLLVSTGFQGLALKVSKKLLNLAFITVKTNKYK